MPVHQRVPERTLPRGHGPDPGSGQGEVPGSLPEDRLGFQAPANRHAGTVARTARERQRKVVRPRVRVHARDGMMPGVKENRPKLAWDTPGHAALGMAYSR